MFAEMHEILFNNFQVKARRNTIAIKNKMGKIAEKDIKCLLTEMEIINKSEDTTDSCSVSKYDENINDAIKLLKHISRDLVYHLMCLTVEDNELRVGDSSQDDARSTNLNNGALSENIDNTKSKVNYIRKKRLVPSPWGKDDETKRIIHKINQLQCLFTWDIMPKTLILSIWNKYGEYNLNMSSPEFTLERFIGNIIISYELFHGNKSELSFWRVLEIGKWLDELDKGTDEFYLSINKGLRHIMKANFIHMLFAKQLTEPSKWVLDETKAFALMDSKSRASVHAIHAAVLIEYGENCLHFTKACKMAEKACNLDPKTSHWFYIHSLALTAQRKFSMIHKSIPADIEINAIHQAVLLSNGKNPLFNYHKLVIDKDTILGNYYDLNGLDHNKEKNKSIIKKNLQNQKIADTIETIINMDPKDPLLVVGCATTLMALPNIVQDFNLGIKYLKKALDMSQCCDMTVFRAIVKAVEAYYNEISKRKNLEATNILQTLTCPKNVKLQLEAVLEFIVNKHNNGEDPFPHLINMASKYVGNDQQKHKVQSCPYSLLYKDVLIYGTFNFDMLIKQSKTVNNDINMQHFSIFGSKKLNLSELIYNEIRLAINTSVAPQHLLFYQEKLTEIINQCNLKILKDVDSSMKANLICSSSPIATFSKSLVQSELNHQVTEMLIKMLQNKLK